jgi:hypothetical protein
MGTWEDPVGVGTILRQERFEVAIGKVRHWRQYTRFRFAVFLPLGLLWRLEYRGQDRGFGVRP